MSYNEHTKKKMQTGVPTENYLNNFDVIFKPARSLDAAYQRKAIDEGWEFTQEALFEENKEYYASKSR